MLQLPKSSAEILAAAKEMPPKQTKAHKPRTDRRQQFKHLLSSFSAKPTTNTSHENIASSSCFHSELANVHPINNILFKDPVTPHTLEAALEIKNLRDVEEVEDLFDDSLSAPLDTWVYSFMLYDMKYISYNFCH